VSVVPLFLYFVFAIFGWCGHSHSPTGKEAEIFAALTAAAGLGNRKSRPTQALFELYVRKRIKYLRSKNPSWENESGFGSYKSRIGAELDRVDTYLTDRLGTLDAPGPMGGAKDPSPDLKHIDLEDVGQPQTITDAFTRTMNAKAFVLVRRERVRQIVWRAAALHPELWSSADSALTADLRLPAMNEIVDRRLRVVEQLSYHDDTRDFPVSAAKWTISGAGGPWKDTFRTVKFEYPWVFETGSFDTALAAAGLTVADLSPTFTRDPAYPRQLDYRDSDIRMRPATAGDWTRRPPPNDYPILLKSGGRKASEVFDDFIPGGAPVDPAFEDFWQRNWIYCDHMIAALHLEALRFGRRRRTGSDDKFDTACAAGYVQLAPLIPEEGKPTATVLMAQADAFFEGVAIPPDELELGDHLVFWNNWFVRLIDLSAFGLENSLVMDWLDPDLHADGLPATTKYQVRLAGHGMEPTAEAAYLDAMAGALTESFQAAQDAVDAAAPGEKVVIVTSRPVQFEVVEWAPYGEATTPRKPWWIRLPLSLTADPVVNPGGYTIAQALNAFPKSVAVDLAHGQVAPPIGPPHAPDYRESIYIPLFEPNHPDLTGGWAQYIAKKNAGESVPSPLPLKRLRVDASLVPGFHHTGPASTLPVYRPKVIP
jgi:hypothetical protein